MLYMTESNNNSSFICSGQGLINLIKKYENPIGLEIGTDIGDTSEFLLNNKKDLTLYTIDPYVDYIDWNGNFIKSSNTYHRYIERTSKFKSRHHHFKNTSDEAIDILLTKNITFDFIFIDGLHTYEQLTKDCHNYYSILKHEGIFSGHDYNAIAEVRKAVNEFAELKHKQISFTNWDVWYWLK